MNSQMLQKSFVFQIIRRKRCVLGWAPSRARLMFSGTRQMFGLQVSTQSQLKRKRGQTGTEATCPLKPEKAAGRRVRVAAAAPRCRGPQHPSRRGLPSRHRTEVTVIQTLWVLPVCLRCGGFCLVGFALLYK